MYYLRLALDFFFGSGVVHTHGDVSSSKPNLWTRFWTAYRMLSSARSLAFVLHVTESAMTDTQAFEFYKPITTPYNVASRRHYIRLLGEARSKIRANRADAKIF